MMLKLHGSKSNRHSHLKSNRHSHLTRERTDDVEVTWKNNLH